LGSDFTAPASLVVDRHGIYYDPLTVSGLEHLLQHTKFTRAELSRAAQLRKCIVRANISKYNPRASDELNLSPRAGQRVLFVPGQVEDDASVQLGGRSIRSNAALLEAVRQRNPDAYIVYKPHPDVVSGNRKGHLSGAASKLCDQLVSSVPLPACLAAADEVHTLTSLVGFEGLLRGLPVTTYGQPFYAGWGLTHDVEPLSRRTRQLTLDELVAGALLRYPRYYSFAVGAFVTAEDVVPELERQRESKRAIPLRSPWLLRKLRKLTYLVQEVAHAR
jgi:capsular polysaccharide export protein